jgi:hypothetical protein
MITFEQYIEEVGPAGAGEKGRTDPANKWPIAGKEQTDEEAARLAGFDTVAKWKAAQEMAAIKAGGYPAPGSEEDTTKWKQDPRGLGFGEKEPPEEIERKKEKKQTDDYYDARPWAKFKLGPSAAGTTTDKTNIGELAMTITTAQHVANTLNGLMQSDANPDGLTQAEWTQEVSIMGNVTLGGKSVGMVGDIDHVQSTRDAFFGKDTGYEDPAFQKDTSGRQVRSLGMPTSVMPEPKP